MTFPFRRLAELCEKAHETGEYAPHPDAAEWTDMWDTPLRSGMCLAAGWLMNKYKALGEAIAVDEREQDADGYVDRPGAWDARLLYLYLRAEEQENP